MPIVRERDLTLRTSVSADDHSVSWKVKCLNCGAALAGPFCAECGQRATPPNPTVSELAGDAFSEFSGWDGKLANTIRALLASPGELTQQWLEGRRVHFISPVRLYLTASFIFFVVSAGAPNLNKSGNQIDLGGLRIGATTDAPSKADKIGSAATSAINSQRALTGAERDSALVQLESAPKLIRPMFRRAVTDPAGLKASIFNTMPKVFFGLVPVFALILGLFYRRRHFPEHLYFAVHFFSFFFIARTVSNLALYTHQSWFATPVQVVIVLWIMYYAVAAIRRVYGGSVGMTILKGIGISVLYGLIAAPIMAAAVIYSAY